MAFWKQKHNQTDGFSLIEAVVAIAILGIIAVPMLTSLLDSYRLNLRSDERLQAQLAVSSAVETIMAEGYNSGEDYRNRFPNVIVSDPLDKDEEGNQVTGPAIRFTVTSSTEDDIYVTTYARPYGMETPAPAPEEGDDNE